MNEIKPMPTSMKEILREQLKRTWPRSWDAYWRQRKVPSTKEPTDDDR